MSPPLPLRLAQTWRQGKQISPLPPGAAGKPRSPPATDITTPVRTNRPRRTSVPSAAPNDGAAAAPAPVATREASGGRQRPPRVAAVPRGRPVTGAEPRAHPPPRPAAPLPPSPTGSGGQAAQQRAQQHGSRSGGGTRHPREAARRRRDGDKRGEPPTTNIRNVCGKRRRLRGRWERRSCSRAGSGRTGEGLSFSVQASQGCARRDGGLWDVKRPIAGRRPREGAAPCPEPPGAVLLRVPVPACQARLPSAGRTVGCWWGRAVLLPSWAGWLRSAPSAAPNVCPASAQHAERDCWARFCQDRQ